MLGLFDSTKTTGNPFKDLGQDWWNLDGPMKPLHAMNSCRMSYIVKEMKNHFNKPMKEIKVLDVGCGGGIVCEPLAVLGCQVTGIDQCEELIQVAKDHGEKRMLGIDYRHCEAKDLNEKFDLVLCLEVVEHVENPEELVQQVCQLTNRICIFSTLNKTISSFVLSVVMAEYLLRWLPKGTHDWQMYISPSQLEQWLCGGGFAMNNIKGMIYNPLFREWKISSNVKVNYIATGIPIQSGTK